MVRLYNEKEKTMCVVTKKDGYVLVSEYVDFRDSNYSSFRLISRMKEYSFDLASVIDCIKKFGFTIMNQGGK